MQTSRIYSSQCGLWCEEFLIPIITYTYSAIMMSMNSTKIHPLDLDLCIPVNASHGRQTRHSAKRYQDKVRSLGIVR